MLAAGGPLMLAAVFVDALCSASRKVDKQITYRELNKRTPQLTHQW